MKYSIFSLALLLATQPLIAEDWPNFQGLSLKGISSETGLNLSDWGKNGPPVLWEKELNEGWGGAAIVGDEVFLIDRDLGETDKLLCLNLKDGTEKWSYTFDIAGKLPHPGSRGVPLVEEDAIYYIGGFGHVVRVNRKTHEADWTLAIQEKYQASPPKWGWAQSPLIVGDVLIAAAMSEEVGLIGLDKKTGKELWKTAGFGDSHSSPTLLNLHGVDQVVFIATKRDGNEGTGTTISVNPKNGKVLWKTDTYFNKIPIPFPTKVTEDLVFLTGGYGCGSCMIKVTHSGDKWEVKKVFSMTQGTQLHPPFVIDQHIYFLANENDNHRGEKRQTGGLACMDFNGKIKWNTGEEPFMGRGNMILADGKLLIQDGEVGYLRVVEPSPSGYKELSKADIFNKQAEVEAQLAKQANRKTKKIPDFKFWSPMALSNGHLIMRGQGTMKCLKLKP